jgi:hypothetical protein
MATGIHWGDAGTIAGVNALCATLNSGTIKLYSGTQPTGANTALSGNTLLSTLTFGATAFVSPAVASGSDPTKVITATANSIASDTSAAATGTASFFRCFETNGTTVILDGTVGTSGCDLNLNTVSIVAGGTVAITSLTITQSD